MIQRIPASSLIPSSLYCVGKNYRLHAEEMEQWEPRNREHSTRPVKENEPLIFLKPSTSLSRNGTTSIPSLHGKPVSENMHYEAELVVLIGKDAENVSEQDAATCMAGYGIGLDMTLRDVQMDARRKGEPWLKCKGFKNSALVSDLIPAEAVPDPDLLLFELARNGTVVQKGAAEKMLFSIPALISYLSYIYGLQAGDLLFTGTPEGVGKVNPGDRLNAELYLENTGDSSPLTSLEAFVSSQ